MLATLVKSPSFWKNPSRYFSYRVTFLGWTWMVNEFFLPRSPCLAINPCLLQHSINVRVACGIPGSLLLTLLVWIKHIHHPTSRVEIRLIKFYIHKIVHILQLIHNTNVICFYIMHVFMAGILCKIKKKHWTKCIKIHYFPCFFLPNTCLLNLLFFFEYPYNRE